MFRFDYYEHYRNLMTDNSPEKREIYKDWISAGGSFDPENDKVLAYLNNFAPIPYKPPLIDVEQSTIDLLLKLVVASMSCHYLFILNDDIVPEVATFGNDTYDEAKAVKLSEYTEDFMSKMMLLLLLEIVEMLSPKFANIRERNIAEYKKNCLKLRVHKFINASNRMLLQKDEFDFSYFDFINGL